MDERVADAGPAGRLTALRAGGRGWITGTVPGTPEALARRLRELGFRRGTAVHCVRRAPLGDPSIYRIGESDVCLRRAEAARITLTTA